MACISFFSLNDSLIFHRMLTSSHPPPFLSRSRNDKLHVLDSLRIAGFGIVLSDSYLLMTALPSLPALAWVIFLPCCCAVLNSCSFSSDYLVCGVWFVLFWYCLCLPCVLLSVFMLSSRQLLCPLQLELCHCLSSPVASQPLPSTLWLLAVAVLQVNSSPCEPSS